MGDERCFQTTAPEAWFGWGLSAAGVAVMATVLAVVLVVRPDPVSGLQARTWSGRLLILISIAPLVISLVGLAGRPRDEAYAMVRQTFVVLLVIAPILGVAFWRARAVRQGRPLTQVQQVVLARARVVTIVIAASAAVVAIAIFAAYEGSAVEVDCSTLQT
ncbi:hypothetical protein [Pedococcus bigeumensis]|uniref:Uncharacterized protein n=1 Tax=Pedococcus bigeumensis TaxID=433644 RepID=A0A502CK15_9MICO|nr:hypothetical protein [Pedococcus bigeumensis]TPG14005.1 hypothetical protein EAH86_17500 [Pedococcus bigeumensis]